MSYPEIIEPILDDVVNRLLEKISFFATPQGGTCQKAGSGRLFSDWSQIPAPFAIVQYGGEVSQDPENMGGHPIIQQVRFGVQIWCGAQSFSPGGTTGNEFQRVGLNTVLDNVWGAMSDYITPAARRFAGSWTKFWHVSNSTPEVTSDFRILSVSTWTGPLVRQSLFSRMRHDATVARRVLNPVGCSDGYGPGAPDRDATPNRKTRYRPGSARLEQREA